MKVLIEADSIAVEKMSGIGHTTLELIRGLSKLQDDYGLHVVAIVPFEKRHYLAKYKLDNVQIRRLPPGYKYVNYLLTRTKYTIPAELFFGRGVYIFPNYKTWYTPFSKSVMFLHDVAYRIYPDSTHPKNLKYLHANMTRWMKRAWKIVTISNSSYEDIVKYFHFVKPKLSVIHLGVDRNVFFRQSKVSIERTKDIYKINGDYFLYVGNIEPRKNIDGLLDAYDIYSDTHDEVGLVLVGGDGWNNEKILHKISHLQSKGKRVIRPNKYVEDEDLPALYSGAIALVHISNHEGYGLSVVQAQACGTPVILSDLPVFHETVHEPGPVFVNNHRVEDIVKAMEKTRQIPVIEHVDLHTWDQTTRELMKLIGIMK